MKTYKTSKGIEKPIPNYGTPEYGLYVYELTKINNKGHNYEYWNDKKHYKMLEDDWTLYEFVNKDFTSETHTSSESIAKESVNKLKKDGNYARIICGYHKVIQKIKYYSIIYKKK